MMIRAFCEVAACLRRFGDLKKNTFLKIPGTRDWGNPMPGYWGNPRGCIGLPFL